MRDGNIRCFRTEWRLESRRFASPRVPASAVTSASKPDVSCRLKMDRQRACRHGTVSVAILEAALEPGREVTCAGVINYCSIRVTRRSSRGIPSGPSIARGRARVCRTHFEAGHAERHPLSWNVGCRMLVRPRLQRSMVAERSSDRPTTRWYHCGAWNANRSNVQASSRTILAANSCAGGGRVLHDVMAFRITCARSSYEWVTPAAGTGSRTPDLTVRDRAS